VQTRIAVEPFVLKRIEDVEPHEPAKDRCHEKEDARPRPRAHRQPCPAGVERERHAEPRVEGSLSVPNWRGTRSIDRCTPGGSGPAAETGQQGLAEGSRPASGRRSSASTDAGLKTRQITGVCHCWRRFFVGISRSCLSVGPECVLFGAEKEVPNYKLRPNMAPRLYLALRFSLRVLQSLALDVTSR
jgi:hypothetical protein